MKVLHWIGVCVFFLSITLLFCVWFASVGAITKVVSETMGGLIALAVFGVLMVIIANYR